MDPRPRRAGGVAVALLLAVALAPASPASAQVRSALQLDDLCWMGPNRPIVRARNLGDQPVPYTLRSGPAMRSGTLAEATPVDADATLGDSARADHDRAADDWAGAGSSAYFVASGRFPDVEPVQVRSTAGEGSGTERNDISEPHHCSYAVRPVLQWYDADGAVMPAPSAAPAVVTLSSSLGRLVCDVAGGELGCTAAPSSDPPLPDGSFVTRPGELAVPAFAVEGQAPTFTVTAAPPPGFRPDGTGTFTLPDLGSGLGQTNVDDRLRPFFADEVSATSGVRDVVVALRRHEGEEPPAAAAAPPGAASPSVTPSTAPSGTVVVSSGRPTPTSHPSPGPGTSTPDAAAARASARHLMPGGGWSSVALILAGAVVAVVLSWLLGGRSRRPWTRWSRRRRPAHGQRDRTERPMVGVIHESYRRPRG